MSFGTQVANPVGDSQRFLLRVRRQEEPLAQTFDITWSTNLTVAFGGGVSPSLRDSQLVCIDKTNDGSPRDEIGVSVDVDGVTMTDLVTMSLVALPVARFKTDSREGMDAVLSRLRFPWRFRTSVDLTLIEDDPIEDEQSTSTIAPLGPGFGPRSFEQTAVVNWFFADGEYKQQVLVSHGLQSFTATP